MNRHLLRTFGTAFPYDNAWCLPLSAEIRLVHEYWRTQPTAVKDIAKQDPWQASNIFDRIQKGDHVEESNIVKIVSREIRFMNWVSRSSLCHTVLGC